MEPQDAEHAVHLRQRLAPEVGDMPRVSCWSSWRAGRSQRLRLDDHQRHVVGDHVVQFARDAHPLLADGLLRPAAPARVPAAPRARLQTVDVVGPARR